MDLFVAWLVTRRSVERCATELQGVMDVCTVLLAGAKVTRTASKMRASGGGDAPFSVVELRERVVER
jgi:hypothetical protein